MIYGDTIQELLQSKDLTLDQTITKCRGLEAAKKSRTEIQHPTQAYSVQATSHANMCIGCKSKPHDGDCKNCPAYKQACRKCGKIGHYSKVCQQGITLNDSKSRTQGTQDPPRAYTLSTLELPFIQSTSGSSTHHYNES